MSFALPTNLYNQELNVIVIGAGGTGSALLTELFQMNYLLRSVSEGQVGVNVTVYDDDLVSFSNIGRQGFWPCDINLNKAEVLVSRLNAYGNVNWTAVAKKFKPSMLNKATDLIISCTDSAQFRSQLGQHFANENHSWLWLDTGNGSSSGQVILGHLGEQDKTLMNVFDYYPNLADIVDIDTDSCSHDEALAKQDYGINKKIAVEATSLLWQLLRHGEVDFQGCFVDIKQGTTVPIKVA